MSKIHNTEVASIVNDINVYEIAEKFQAPSFSLNSLSSEEKDVVATVNAWAQEIGERGNDRDHQISAFIQNVIEPQVYNVPDELLEKILEKGSIGEFDAVEYSKVTNTLEAYEAAKGGTVDKSYLDFGKIVPQRKHIQLDTELRYSDLRKNGFKTISNVATAAYDTLRNKRFFMILNMIDAAITAGDQVHDVTGATVNATAMDKIQQYLLDYSDNGLPLTISLSKYAQQIIKLTATAGLMSEEMKNQLHRTGLLGYYNGLEINQIAGAKKTGRGELLLPDKRIFGFAGTVGSFNEVADLRVYQDMDNQGEKVNLKFTGYEFEVGLTNIERAAKVTFSA